MTRSENYEGLKVLARKVRSDYGLTTPKVTLTDLRRIYKDHGIKIILWKGPLRGIRGHYSNDDLGPTVMVSAKLPKEQRIFTMAHELKHHLVDHVDGDDAVGAASDHVEIGAEIFAVELIYPEDLFKADLGAMGVTTETFSPESIVRLKRQSETTLSFTALAKLAVWLGFTTKEAIANVKWKILEESLFGEPAYKRIQRIRSQRSGL